MENPPQSTDTHPTQAKIDGNNLYNTKELFGSSSEVLINHRGELYRLRITRFGKLILTK